VGFAIVIADARYLGDDFGGALWPDSSEIVGMGVMGVMGSDVSYKFPLFCDGKTRDVDAVTIINQHRIRNDTIHTSKSTMFIAR